MRTKKNFKKCVLKGRAADKMTEVTNLGDFNPIVVGNCALGGIQELFLESTSDWIVDKAKCPVLIIEKPSTCKWMLQSSCRLSY